MFVATTGGKVQAVGGFMVPSALENALRKDESIGLLVWGLGFRFRVRAGFFLGFGLLVPAVFSLLDGGGGGAGGGDCCCAVVVVVVAAQVC